MISEGKIKAKSEKTGDDQKNLPSTSSKHGSETDHAGARSSKSLDKKPIVTKHSDSAGKERFERKSVSENIDIKTASELARTKLADVLGKTANATISIERQGEDWAAFVEIVDEEYLPGQNMRSMSDIIGVYEVTLSSTGELLKFVRKRSNKRGDM
jgi:hypothetical protein